MCAHVCGASHRYAHYIRKARGVDFIEHYQVDPALISSPRDVRRLLAEGIVFTEATVEPLRASTRKKSALSCSLCAGGRPTTRRCSSSTQSVICYDIGVSSSVGE